MQNAGSFRNLEARPRKGPLFRRGVKYNHDSRWLPQGEGEKPSKGGDALQLSHCARI